VDPQPQHRYHFDCPWCDRSVVVGESLRTAMLTYGCLSCGGTVTADAFVDR